MQVFDNDSNLAPNLQPFALALGMFDGFHIGHQALMRAVEQVSAQLQLQSAVYTFSNHPNSVLRNQPVQLLLTKREKLRLLQSFGIQTVFMPVFDAALAGTQANVFLQRYLALGMRAAVAGFNYRFGAKAQGDVDLLQAVMQAQGLQAVVVQPVQIEGVAVSTTRIKQMLLQGDVQTAQKALGWYYSVAGTVVQGKQLGRTIGFPTINIAYDAEKLLPKMGVYAGVAQVDGAFYPAMVNIGTNPTVQSKDAVFVEAHILNFSRELYGANVRLHFVQRLRDEERFASLQALMAQLQRDKAQTAHYFMLRDVSNMPLCPYLCE